jgi:predicted DNA-binding transcriptional regulator AlpA
MEGQAMESKMNKRIPEQLSLFGEQNVEIDNADKSERSTSTSSFIDIPALCQYLGVKKTWVYDRTAPSATDPIPHFKMGKYVRFDINSDAFKAWLQRNFRF